MPQEALQQTGELSTLQVAEGPPPAASQGFAVALQETLPGLFIKVRRLTTIHVPAPFRAWPPLVTCRLQGSSFRIPAEMISCRCLHVNFQHFDFKVESNLAGLLRSLPDSFWMLGCKFQISQCRSS